MSKGDRRGPGSRHAAVLRAGLDTPRARLLGMKAMGWRCAATGDARPRHAPAAKPPRVPAPRRLHALRTRSKVEAARRARAGIAAPFPTGRGPNRPDMQIYLPIAELSLDVFLLLGMGGVIGFLSGIFGVGGGFLMTPLLIFIGVPPPVAVATQANNVVASSISGVLAHFRRGNVDVKMGVVLLIGGLIGSTVGVSLFRLLRELGQIDLVINLSYVIFLGTIGALMTYEGGMAVIRRQRKTPARKAHKHNWAHGLPFKMRFHRWASASACCRRSWAWAAASCWCRR